MDKNKSKIFEISEVKIGAKDIIDGLKYHFENFKRLSSTIKCHPGFTFEYKEEINKMNHETTAYLNRLGQFYYFATSETIKAKIKEPEKFMSTIVHFLPFRHKQTAHRAIDVPEEEDLGQNREWMNQVNRLFSDQCMFADDRLIFQLTLGEGEPLNLDLLKEHEKIIQEAESLLSKL